MTRKFVSGTPANPAPAIQLQPVEFSEPQPPSQERLLQIRDWLRALKRTLHPPANGFETVH